ncbi:MAG: hypothetical protein ACREBB_00815 [Nitrosotalea sp.]
MKDFDPTTFLEPDERLLLTCFKPELKEKASLVGKFIGVSKHSQIRDQANYDRGYGVAPLVRPELLHVDSDILLITDKRFLMIKTKNWRWLKSPGARYTTIFDFDVYLDKTYALKNAQEIHVQNEESVDKVKENVEDANYLKKMAYMYGFNRKEITPQTYGYVAIPPILVGVEKEKHMLGKEELELKLAPVPVVKTKRFGNPDWVKKFERFASKFPTLSKEVFSLKVKEKEKIDELYKILKQKSDENKDFLPSGEV